MKAPDQLVAFVPLLLLRGEPLLGIDGHQDAGGRPRQKNEVAMIIPQLGPGYVCKHSAPSGGLPVRLAAVGERCRYVCCDGGRGGRA